MKLKTLPGPGGHITPVEDGMVGGVGGGGAGVGGAYTGFPWRARSRSQYSESRCSVPALKRRSISL